MEEIADMVRFARGAALHALRAGDRGVGRRKSLVDRECASTPDAAAGGKPDRFGGLSALAPDARIGVRGVASQARLALLTGNSLLESGVKLAYCAFLVFLRRNDPVWMLPVTALLAIPVAWLLWTGAWSGHDHAFLDFARGRDGANRIRGRGRMGYLCFGPARLLFLLPLAMLAIAAGVQYNPRAGTVIAGALLAANVVGIGSYFQARDLLNIGYLAPMERIAQDSPAALPLPTRWCCRRTQSERCGAGVYFPGFSTRQIFTEQDAELARREIANPAIRHVWFLRNPRDVTPGHLLERLETDSSPVVARTTASLCALFTDAQSAHAGDEC